MSLIHWWPLNGNTTDYGINSTALINNGATVNSAGKIGKCYYFDGNASYLQTTIEAGLFDGTGHPFSFTFWMKFTDELVDRKIIFGDYSLANPYFNIEMSYGSESYSGRMRFCWSNGCDYWFTVATGIKDTWQHYAITYDGINKISLYKDGTFIESATATLNAASSGTYYIGRDGRTGSTALKGYLNDFRIYNHALSAKEVKEISKGLVLHYNFEDEYIEPTTNLCNSITPAKYSGWGTIKAAQLKTNSYSLRNTASNASQLSVWDSWGYDVSSYIGQTITFSAMIKDIQFVNVNNNTSWIAIGQANSGQYPNHITSSGTGNFIQYVGSNSIVKGTRLTWTGIIQEPGRVLFELWTYASSAGGYIQLDLSEIQIEVKDHATPYVNGTRSTGKVYDSSGYGNNGTIRGNIQISSDSANGQHSVKFDGNGANCVYETTTPQYAKDFTFNVWCYQESESSPQANQYIFSQGRDYPTSGFSIITGNGTAFLIGPFGLINSGINIVGGWHMITGTYDGANVKCYVDGVLKASLAYTNDLTYTYAPAVVLGKMAHGYTLTDRYFMFNGKIADAKIYSTALSAEDIQLEYSRKAAIDKKGNIFTGEFIETNTNAKIADKNNQIKATYFVEGKDKVKIFGGYTELDYFDQINPAAGATSQHNRCTISDISYDHIEARVKVTGQGSSGGIVFSNGMWWKTYTGRGNVNDGSGTVTMTPTSFSQNIWTDVSWDFSKVFSALWTSGWSDGINYWTPQNLKVAYIKTYIGSELTGHFIPVKNKNNVIGLFNLITNKFYSNTGTGTESFVAGNSLGKLSLIQENKIEEL